MNERSKCGKTKPLWKKKDKVSKYLCGVWYKNKQEFPKENLKGINCKADKT
jgi:hypothetical protein